MTSQCAVPPQARAQLNESHRRNLELASKDKARVCLLIVRCIGSGTY